MSVKTNHRFHLVLATLHDTQTSRALTIVIYLLSHAFPQSLKIRYANPVSKITYTHATHRKIWASPDCELDLSTIGPL